MKKSKYRVYTDNELAELMFQGDGNAYAELYDRYFAVIYSFNRRMLHDDDQAEDLTQEIFMALYESATQTSISSVRSYLYQSARYALIDHARKQKSRYDYLAGLQDYYQKGVWSTDDTVIERDLQQLIESEIDKLPSKMRAIFELSRKHYLSNKEIADNLNLSEGTVRQQIHNALVRLRSRLTCFLLLQITGLLSWIGHS
ncbi:RNA polymerase sigma factor [Sphingobacterium sp. CZ-2]|nr:sigma-70 family RNA polymerase sigma factor [Sphingobacterium sp. CZ-2]